MSELDTPNQKLYELLKDWRWRMRNLYWIKDKTGNAVQFKPNAMQEYLMANLHPMMVWLKSRQQGFTTFAQMFGLDKTLFYRNKSAAVVAHIREDAEAFFENKIKFAYDRLPDWLKQALHAETDTAHSLKFSNGSSISVGTNLRSGTNQFLHISELGPMSIMYPQRAKEVIAGAFNTVHAGQTIIVESTAKGRQGEFYELCMQAQKIRDQGLKLGPMDFKFMFFPWFDDPSCALPLDGSPIGREVGEYCQSLIGRARHFDGTLLLNITPEQQLWYSKKLAIMRDDMTNEYPSTPEESFQASADGLYYAAGMQLARQQGRIMPLVVNPNVPVDTWWDLGVDDYTSIIFVQNIGGKIRIVDFYENSGESLQHYAVVLQNKKYLYGTHYGPHDLKQRTLQTGKSTYEVALSLGVNFQIVPSISIQDGINVVRDLFSRFVINSELTKLVAHFDGYRKKPDLMNGGFKKDAVHDEHSHSMDAVRIGSVAWQEVYQPSRDNDYDDGRPKPGQSGIQDDGVFRHF